jgi:hypothetical protein
MLICLIEGRKTAPLTLSLSFFFLGGAYVPSAPSGSATVNNNLNEEHSSKIRATEVSHHDIFELIQKHFQVFIYF